MKRTKENTWYPEKIWDGDLVYILGGGPSLLKFDLDRIKDEHVIGTNQACFLGNWVDVGWFGDAKWLKLNYRRFREFKGIRASCNHDIDVIKRNHTWINFMARSERKQGIETEPGKVCWNKSTGGAAINLAYHLGARIIVLVGFDMHDVNGRKNYHNDYGSNDADAPWRSFLVRFETIAKDAHELGLKILNATPGSSIKELPIINLNKHIGS